MRGSRKIFSTTVYGPQWSAYTRTVLLALIEKGAEYTLHPVDFSNGTMPVEQLQRHPFGKVPVLCHGDFRLYETSAICRYIDAAFAGPSLQPANPRSLGRMAQIIAVIDTYLSEPIRMGYVSEKLIHPMMGLAVDDQRATSAAVAIKRGFSAIEALVESTTFLVEDQASLADCHAAPLFDYLALTPGGQTLIDEHPRLQLWWSNMSQRVSVLQTQPDLSVFGFKSV